MRTLLAAAPLIVITACGGGVPDDIVGRIVVANGITAQFEARSTPEIVVEEGDCRVIRVALECVDTHGTDIPCWGRPQPDSYSVGPLTVVGLNQIEPVLPAPPDHDHIYQYDGEVFTPMSRPEWTIGASAPGDELPGFDLSVPGVLDFPDATTIELPVPAGQPITVTWDPAVPADPALVIELGASFAAEGEYDQVFDLNCTGTDTGTMTISPVVSAVLAAHLPLFSAAGGLSRAHQTTLSEPGREIMLVVGAGRGVSFGPPLVP